MLCMHKTRRNEFHHKVNASLHTTHMNESHKKFTTQQPWTSSFLIYLQAHSWKWKIVMLDNLHRIQFRKHHSPFQEKINIFFAFVVLEKRGNKNCIYDCSFFLCKIYFTRSPFEEKKLTGWHFFTESSFGIVCGYCTSQH